MKHPEIKVRKKPKPKEKQLSHKNNSKVFDEIIIKRYKPFQMRSLSGMKPEYFVSRRITFQSSTSFLLSHLRSANFFLFVYPAVNSHPHQKQTCFVKKKWKFWKDKCCLQILWNIYTLAHQTLSKKVRVNAQSFCTDQR